MGDIILGKTKSEQESIFVLDFPEYYKSLKMTGICYMNYSFKKLGIEIPDIEINYKSSEFRNFVVDERDCPDRIFNELKKYESSKDLSLLCPDATYKNCNGEPIAFAEINTVIHFGTAPYGEDKLKSTLISDFAKRKISETLGIPLLEYFSDIPLLSTDVENICKFFKDNE